MWDLFIFAETYNLIFPFEIISKLLSEQLSFKKTLYCSKFQKNKIKEFTSKFTRWVQCDNTANPFTGVWFDFDILIILGAMLYKSLFWKNVITVLIFFSIQTDFVILQRAYWKLSGKLFFFSEIVFPEQSYKLI